jgi:ankyrin repeat protein
LICPDALKEKNSWGSLPLHAACENDTHSDVVKLLINLHPDGVKEKDKDGSLPLHIACKSNAPYDVI